MSAKGLLPTKANRKQADNQGMPNYYERKRLSYARSTHQSEPQATTKAYPTIMSAKGLATLGLPTKANRKQATTKAYPAYK